MVGELYKLGDEIIKMKKIIKKITNRKKDFRDYNYKIDLSYKEAIDVIISLEFASKRVVIKKIKKELDILRGKIKEQMWEIVQEEELEK